MPFRFIHAADLHLDTPFSGLSAAAPEVGGALRDASLLAFDNLVRLALSREAAFVLIAGDVYDGSERGVRAQLEFHRGLSRLAEHGIRTFVAFGNHDPVDEGWSAVRNWPELVTVFPAGAPESHEVMRDGRLLATVHGISYAKRSCTENLARHIAPAENGGLQIAVLHANVGGNADHDPYSPCTLDELVGTGIDYWALGHVHTRQVLHRDPWVVYPGNLQARSPRPSERGPKGALVVEVDDAGGIGEPEFVALDRVRFDHAELGVEGVVDLPTLREKLADLGYRRLAEADDRSILLRVEVSGRSPVHADLYRPGALAELLELLRADAPSDAPFLWWDRIDLATKGLWDLDDLKGRNDFVADLVDEAANVIEDQRLRGQRTTGWDDELPADLEHLLGGTAPRADDPERWIAAQELAIDLVAGAET